MAHESESRTPREVLAKFLEWDGKILLVSRASLGLQAVLMHRKRENHQRVALSPIVCQDVVSAILNAGCTPFFLDVDSRTGEVPGDEWIRGRDAGCTTAVVVHLFGRYQSLDAVKSVFSEPEHLVVDDGAQAFGTRGPEGMAGTLADVGLLSFGSSKHVGIGGAALLLRDKNLLTGIKRELGTMATMSAADVMEIEGSFRSRFDSARGKLVSEKFKPEIFAGLLQDYGVSLYRETQANVFDVLPEQIETYGQHMQVRRDNAHNWQVGLAGSEFKDIGFRDGDVPWRYACRLEGASWQKQHDVAEAIRRRGVHVSNWYIPANWYIANSPRLGGAEKFARETFQFWVEPPATKTQIRADITQVHEALRSVQIRST